MAKTSLICPAALTENRLVTDRLRDKQTKTDTRLKHILC